MADVRKNTTDATWLRPDCKSQVALKYDNGEMAGIENVVVSTQHAEAANNETIRSFITEEISSHPFLQNYFPVKLNI